MTAIIKDRDVKASPATKAGLVLPGLGHILAGEFVIGIGLMLLVGVLVWSAAAGFPRLGEVMHSAFGGRLAVHALVAITTWVLTAMGVWWTAYRRAFPRVLSDAEFNSNWQVFLRQFHRNRTGLIGMFGVLVMVTLVLLTPLLAAFEPNAIDMGPKNTAPGWVHLMGTDEFGRDLFSRVLYGGRISLSIGFVAVAIAGTIGTTVGAVAAFGGGWIDRLLMWLVDMLLSLPRLVLLIAIAGMFRVTGPEGLFIMVAILGLTGWMGVSRIVRSQVLSLKEQDFIQAARALGLSNARIVFRHLIPNALAPVIVFCSLAIGTTMIVEAGLSFLGLGVPPPTSTWGTIINDGREPLRVAPWIATFPGLCIVFAVMSFNLLGDGLRDALDPKLRGS
jgi:peptide/nickel transport system permease protein